MSPECQFCLLTSETISHLYWFCTIVSQFLNDSFTFISGSDLNFKPTQEQFIFGFINESFNTPANYFNLLLKKFKNEINLSLVGFKNYLFSVLSDLKNNPACFTEWEWDLYVLLEPKSDNDINEDHHHGGHV